MKTRAAQGVARASLLAALLAKLVQVGGLFHLNIPERIRDASFSRMTIVRFWGSVGTRLALDSVAGKMPPHLRPGIFMTKGIGIDFGTSNSAAAIFDGDELKLVQLESADAIIPSATYIDRALTSKTGQLAVESIHCRQHRPHCGTGA